MASVSPDMYRGKQKKVQNFIRGAQEFLQANWSVRLLEDFEEHIEAGNRLIGELEILKKSLDGLEEIEKYKRLINAVEIAVQKIKNAKKQFIRDSERKIYRN